MTPPTRDGQVRTARRRKRRRRAALRPSPKSRCRRRRTRRRRLVVGFAALVAPRGWGDFCLALEGHSTRPPRTERTECSRRAVQAGSGSHVRGLTPVLAQMDVAGILQQARHLGHTE